MKATHASVSVASARRQLRSAGLGGLLVLAAALAGCLEVQQHPRWEADKDGGQYDGKHDQRVQAARFHGDRLAWNAAITDRTLQQDEYRRARPEIKQAPPPPAAR